MSHQRPSGNRQVWRRVAALAGLTGVGLGAFGAHGLDSMLDNAARDWWAKAVFYHLSHAVAMLAVALYAEKTEETVFRSVLWGFVFGILLFSGSLYLLALTHWRWLVWVTPLGGLSLLWGWSRLLVGSGAGRRRESV